MRYIPAFQSLNHRKLIRMSYLNASIPPQYCRIRSEFLGLDEKYKLNCVIFGFASIPGYATLFHCQLTNGAVYYRLPINAFCHNIDASRRQIDHLQLWNSFSYYPAVNVYDWLVGQKAEVLFKDGSRGEGAYLFTIDWAHPEGNVLNSGLSEHHSEHKCGHFLKLDDGNYAIQPNNRLLWKEASFITSDDELYKQFKTNQPYPNVESMGKWCVKDGDKQYYGE